MNALQEEITQKTLALCVQTGKMTAQLLQQAMKKVLADMEKHKNDPQLRHGKQTIRQLGLPPEMDGRILWAAEPEGVPRITENTADRALRLKTLGNAVCPPQAYPIFKYISMIETGECVSICPYGKAGGDA